MKNKGLLHPGVTYVTNEEPLQTHMIRRGATYYMRRLVPEELRPYFLTKTGQPRTEFTVSLRTKEHATAKERLEKECTKVTALFKEARRKLEAGIPHHTTGAIDRAASYDRWQDEQVALQEVAFQRDMEEEATEADHDAALARDMSRPYEELSSYEKAIRRNLQSELFDSEAVKVQRKRAATIDYEAAGKAFSEAAEKFGIEGALKPRYPRLMDLYDRCAKANDHSDSTKKRWSGMINHLISFLGHDDASILTAEKCREWRDWLQKEPIKDKAGNPKVRSSKTIREGYLSAIKATLNYAVDEGLLKENPVANVKVSREKRIIRRKDKGFRPNEARTILNAAICIETNNPNSRFSNETLLARRWVPWLCAYTGARVSELTQLREMDIECQDGIWFITITPDAGTVKNNEVREVPLHPHLLEQGFHKLAVKGSPNPIFYDPTRGRGGSAANPHYKKVSERLAAWVRELGVTDADVAPNHGWRHLFTTVGRTLGVPGAALDAMLLISYSNCYIRKNKSLYFPIVKLRPG